MAQLKYQLDYTERMVRMWNRSMFMAEYNLEFGIWADIPGMYICLKIPVGTWNVSERSI